MTLPDDPQRSPDPPPQAEYRADYDGIRSIAWIALGCAVVIAFVALFNMSGIGEGVGESLGIQAPALSTYTMNENYGTDRYVTPRNALVGDIWKWGGLFAIISLLVGIWHWARGSGITRSILKVLLVGWLIWTLAGVLLAWEAPTDSGEVISNNRGGIVQSMPTTVSTPARPDEPIKFVILGIICCFLLSIAIRLPDYDSKEAMVASGRLRSPGSSSKDQIRHEFDTGGFHIGYCILIVLLTFLPAILDGLLGAEGLIYAFTMWITFPAWIIINPFTSGVDEGALAVFIGWAVIALVLCLWHLRYPTPGKAVMLLINLMLAMLFVWASLPHIAGAGSYLHAGLIFGFSTLLAIFGALLICIPIRQVRIGDEELYADSSTRLELAPGVLVEAYAAFCGNCGQQVHARNGQCLYCGGGVHAL